MKMRHWAPLGALAWYLLIPPAGLNPTAVQNEPLSTWQIVRGFDHSDDCEDYKDDFVRSSAQKHSLSALEPNYRYYMYAECIASNDPRLFYGKK
jgi:hypothetical protein